MSKLYPTMTQAEEDRWTNAIYDCYMNHVEDADAPENVDFVLNLYQRVFNGTPKEVRQARTWMIKSLRKAAESAGIGHGQYENAYGLPPGYLRSGLNFEPDWVRRA